MNTRWSVLTISALVGILSTLISDRVVCEAAEETVTTNSPNTNQTTNAIIEKLKDAYQHIHDKGSFKGQKITNQTDNQTNNQTEVSKKKAESEPQKHNMIKDPQFEYIIANKGLCDQDTNLFIWVHTAPHQQRKRLTLRETWANPHSFPPGYKAKMGFFIGAIEHVNPKISSKIHQQVEFENEFYHDIIQQNYVDHYHNMSYKAISAVRWITNYCPQAKLVIKTDDDTLIDLPLIFHHIHSLQSHGQMLNNSILCRVYERARVKRGGKWRILKSEYEENKFPSYCQGLAMVMTGDVARRLYNESRRLTPLWIDDVWMFGIVLKQTNAKIIQVTTKQDNAGAPPHLTLQRNELYLHNYVPFYHLHKINLIHNMWRKMNVIWKLYERSSNLIGWLEP